MRPPMAGPAAALLLLALLEGAAAARVAAASRRRRRGGVAEAGLPMELQLHVIGFVPWAPEVAWSAGAEATSLWMGDGEPLRALRGSVGRYVVDIKFFPAGDRLVTLGSDGAGVIWSAASGRVLHTLRREGDVAPPLEVQVFPDGDRLVALGADRHAVIWSAASGAALRTLELRAPHRAVRVLPPGDRVVTGVSDLRGEGAVIWNASDGQALHTLRQLGGPIRLIEVSPCGAKVVTASFWEGTFVWDAAAGRLDRVLPRRAGEPVAVAVSRGGAKVVSSLDRRIFIWSGLTGQLRRTLFMQDSIVAFALVSGGARVVALTASAAVVWDCESGRRLRAFGDDDVGEEPQRIAVSGNGEVVAVCGGALRPWGRQWATIWDTATGRRLHTQPQLNSHMVIGGGAAWPCSVAVGSGDVLAFAPPG